MMRRVLLCAALWATVACENGGATRTLGIASTGIISGRVYFDANGSRAFDTEDAPFVGARVRITAPGGRDTLFRATTGTDGTFRLPSVPVGTYAITIDSASAGDSALVVEPTPVVVTLLPADSVQFEGAISYPLRTIAAARLLAPGTRVFIAGVALHARDTYSDTTLHVVDATGAMRATRVRPSAIPVAAGDSVILRARIGTRLGQRVLDDVFTFVVTPTILPSSPTVTTAVAATGGTAGVLDASLVRLLNVLVSDTATVAGNLQMTVSDGSGPVIVVLDRAADPGFRPPLPVGLYVPANRLDISGVLVPTGTGAWRVKPRSVLDLVDR